MQCNLFTESETGAHMTMGGSTDEMKRINYLLITSQGGAEGEKT